MNRPRTRVTTALLERRARDLKRHLPLAVAGDDQGVHQARVASRRLREAVPVLTTGLKAGKADKANRKIRRLTRALGTVRELDVTLQLLDALSRSKDVARAAIEEVRAHVITKRDDRRDTVLRRLDRVNVEKLDRRLKAVADALQESTDERWRLALAARLLKRTRRLVAAMDDAGQIYNPEGLHEVRIAAKKLRYALEIAADSRVASARAHVQAIKRAQEMLGRLHDLQVLQAYVATVQARGSGGGAMAARLEALARHIEDQCRHLHGRYTATSPVLRQVCADIAVAVVPGLERVRGRSPLKMTLSARASADHGQPAVVKRRRAGR
jgi:CHAD domain-containing protein